jgi:spoIIIJ-associated protein
MATKKLTTKSKKGDKLDDFTKAAENLLALMGTKATLKVEKDKEEDTVLVKIDGGEETGLIIGNRGRTLNSIQTLLGLIYKTKMGEWKRISVDVSDWREKETHALQNLRSIQPKEQKETGEAQSLYNLTPSQRRVVHLTLSEDDDVETESQEKGQTVS